MTNNCTKTSIPNLIAITDGVKLYENSNKPPESYGIQGQIIGDKIKAINGKKVIAFGGMSNWNQEVKLYLKLYKTKYKHRNNTFFNGCRGGWDLKRMAESEANAYWVWYQDKLKAAGITPDQVQVLFFKNSLAGRGGQLSVLDHMKEFKRLLNLFLARAKKELPGLQQIFLTSAVYSGYAGNNSPRIEPHAYCEGLVMKEVILEHIAQPVQNYWLAWGPYAWANGVIARSDGLTWQCNDFDTKDGVHPGPVAELKVAQLLLTFMETNPATKWFYN